jgi:hypothetical protein
MIERTSSGFGKLSSLVVRFWARFWRMSSGKGTRAAFATGLALSGVLTNSSTAPALLEGANLRTSDAGCDDGAGLRRFTAPPPAPAGLIVEYRAVRGDSDPSVAEPYGDGVPFAVRSPLTDDQLFTEAPALVAASEGDADDFSRSSANASRHKVWRPAKARAASAARFRKSASLQVTGCSRCARPIVIASPRRANLFASPFLENVFRNARFVRRGNRPTGVAQQRVAPRLTAWSFRRT